MKTAKKRGEYFRTRISGLAVIIFSLTVMLWHLIDSLLIERVFNMIDLFSIAFTLLTAMVGGVILFTAYQKELIAELGLWLDDFGQKVRKASWPLEREMLEIVGERKEPSGFFIHFCLAICSKTDQRECGKDATGGFLQKTR